MISVDQDVGYYEIYPSCILDVTSSDVAGITTCTNIISGCREKNLRTSGTYSDQAHRNHPINRISDNRRKSPVHTGKCNDRKFQQIQHDKRPCQSDITF